MAFRVMSLVIVVLLVGCQGKPKDPSAVSQAELDARLNRQLRQIEKQQAKMMRESERQAAEFDKLYGSADKQKEYFAKLQQEKLEQEQRRREEEAAKAEKARPKESQPNDFPQDSR